VDVSTGSITNVTGSNGVVRPAVSPTQQLLAYDNISGIFLVPSSGGSSTLLAPGGFDPSFSPDGSALAFVTKSGGNHSIASIGVTNGTSNILYTTSKTIESPVWVENRIFFMEHLGLGYDGRSAVTVRSISVVGGNATTEKSFERTVAEFDVSVRTDRALIVDDFDGGGRDDLAEMRSADGAWLVHESSGNSFEPAVWSSPFSPPTGWSSISGDFTGDGRADIANYSPGNGTWWISKSSGSSFSTSRWAYGWPASKKWEQYGGDFNGDGLEDVASYSPVDGSLWVSVSTGTGFKISQWNP
jgi:hypothetical protein